ncbi:unnamed protein product [Mytilus coruscus]|uniref:Uncharacterized protein n=1 Tax=Mytilus coruscus TaxID=42192 RepID=A0A6J8CPY0_MYTCO|nr:unnamed protein product [Mytilus coruscus]
MNIDGKHLTRYRKDKNNKSTFDGAIWSVTCMLNENIFVVQKFNNPRVVVLGKTDVINIYTGHPSVNSKNPQSVITTPLDNGIVLDHINHTLHLLDNTGHLLHSYKTNHKRILFPSSLAITMEGPFAGCHTYGESSETGKLYTKWESCIQNGKAVYKMGKLYTKRESCIQNGKAVYKTGKLYTKRESCIQNGKAVYKTGKLYTKRESCIQNGKAVYKTGKLYTK